MTRRTTRAVLAGLALLILAMLVSPSSARAACSSPAGGAGDIVYNGTQKLFQYCNGTDWTRMNLSPGSGAGGCVLPSGTVPEGQLIYHMDHRVLSGCAGNVERAMSAAGGKFGWKQVSVGSSHTCGIKSDDSLWCWGDNSGGQLGDNSTTERLVPTAVNGGGTWKQVSVQASTSCGIKSDDSLWCWGRNNVGRVGDNSTTDRLVPTAVSGGGTWKQVSTSCGIKSDDSLWCWGLNSDGQLGDNSTTTRLVPTAVNGGGTWKQVSTGDIYACAIKSDNTLYCWGDNLYGQLGDNSTTDRLVPTAVSGGGSWKQVATSEQYSGHTCAIKSDDTLRCWGFNSSGQLGDNSTTNRLVPTAVSGGGSWKQVSAGNVFSCGIKADDTSRCWGSNADGQTGLNTVTGNTLIPTSIFGGGSWKQMAVSYSHTCAIKSDDSLWCWGSNANGKLGDNSAAQRFVPTVIYGGGTWKQLSTTRDSTCAVKTDDNLYCWGFNSSGQLGDNSTTDRLVPTAVSGGGSWRQVEGGSSHTCGIKTDDTLYCWGSNSSGQLGDNSTTQRLVPTAINGGGSWKQVSAGSSHTCGIKADDTLWCWGFNVNGRLGDNSTTQRLIPTAINGGGTWKQVAAGQAHTCAIKSDDTLYCWGSNVSGRTGLNTAAGNTLIPTPISGGGAWKQVEGGWDHTCAIKLDDSLHCWGLNSNGQTGLNTTVGNTLVPTEIFGGGAWKRVAVGSNNSSAKSHNCAVKSDDTLFCWGNNSGGRLGDGTTTMRLVATATSGGEVWSQVVAGFSHTCAISSNSALLCWGANGFGQLTATDFSAPYRLTGLSPWCGEPTGKAGTMIYNSDLNVMQYCDGVGWVKVGK